MHDQRSTPLADALRTSKAMGRHNFHAVPWGGDCPVEHRDLRAGYEAIFGAEFAPHDLSYGGAVLDSFFRPRRGLLAAQEIAAEAFGADQTYFLSGGSTLGNAIAIAAVAGDRGKLLIDPAAHQSVHFAADQLGVEVVPIPTSPEAVFDLDATTRELADAAARGRPYAALVLTASTYDGQRLAVETILANLVAASPKTVFVFDDAWAAIHTFSPLTDTHSPVRAARALLDAGGDCTVLVVQSAHKTMRAMRQATYLHVVGGDRAFRTRVAESVFRCHTTSPSWPVLASLDLARAHAVAQGAALVARSLRLSARLAELLGADARHDFSAVPAVSSSAHHVLDSMKMRIRVPRGLDPVAVRCALWTSRGIHIPRVVGRDLLLSMTIGIGDEAIEDLADGLAACASMPDDTTRAATDRRQPAASDRFGGARGGFVIAYPPGVPMSAPYLADGDPDRTGTASKDGAEIFAIRSMSPNRRRNCG